MADEPKKIRCPVCEAREANADPATSFAYGMIVRDVVEMEKIAKYLCPEDEVLMLMLYDLMVEICGEKTLAEQFDAATVTPDKDLN